MVINHPKKCGEWFSTLMGHRGLVYWAMGGGEMVEDGRNWRSIRENGGKWGRLGGMGEMCQFWKTEWENGDIPRKKRWKMVAFSAIGGLMGDQCYWGTGGGYTGRWPEEKWEKTCFPNLSQLSPSLHIFSHVTPFHRYLFPISPHFPLLSPRFPPFSPISPHFPSFPQ